MTANRRKRRLALLASLAGMAVMFSPLILYLAVLFAAHDFNRDFLWIDSCHDQGRSWNYERRECEGAR